MKKMKIDTRKIMSLYPPIKQRHGNTFQVDVTNTVPIKNISIKDVIEILKDTKTKSLIEEIRTNLNDDKIRNNLKCTLQGVTFGGIFKHRNKGKIITQSGYAPIDIDGVPADHIELLQKKLAEDPYTYLVWKSPSGNAFKLIIKIQCDVIEFPERVKAFYDYLKKQYNMPVKFDISTHDISRLCFIGWTDWYLCKEDAKEWTHKPEPIFQLEGLSEQGEIEYKISDLADVRDTSRSANEFKQIMDLMKQGMTDIEVSQWMTKNNPYGKWNEDTQHYRDLSIANARKRVSQPLGDKNSKERAEAWYESIAIDIVNQFPILTTKHDTSPEMFIYDHSKGIFLPEGESEIKSILFGAFQYKSKNNVITRIMYKVKLATLTHPDEIFKNDNHKNLICLRNGVYDIKNHNFLSHSPKYRFLKQYNIVYDSNARNPETVKHYHTLLEPAYVKSMQEIYGFILYPEHFIAKFFLFWGEGENGKSVSFNHIREFCGFQNCCSHSISDLNSNRFVMSDLFIKIVNISDDIGSSAIEELKELKTLTGNASVTGDRKHKTTLTFVNNCKLLFNANRIPHFKDDSPGFWRRPLLIPFMKKIIREGNPLPHEVRLDPDILDKILTEEEISGTFNWAIEGLKRLKQIRYFSTDIDEDETKKLMETYSSNSYKFMRDNIISGEATDVVIFTDLFQRYIEYCTKKGLRAISKFKFKQELKIKFTLNKNRLGTTDIVVIRNYKMTIDPEKGEVINGEVVFK